MPSPHDGPTPEDGDPSAAARTFEELAAMSGSVSRGLVASLDVPV